MNNELWTCKHGPGGCCTFNTTNRTIEFFDDDDDDDDNDDDDDTYSRFRQVTGLNIKTF